MKIVAPVLMAAVLALVPSGAFPDDDRLERAFRGAQELQNQKSDPGAADRLERGFRDGHELQKRQDQRGDAGAWLRSSEGQKWGKTFHSTPQEPMTVVGPMWNAPSYLLLHPICSERIKSKMPEHSTATPAQVRGWAGPGCEGYADELIRRVTGKE
jgi:hypothetical protein